MNVLGIAILVLGGMTMAAQQRPPAITDEAKVPVYTLPDPLRCADGTVVTDRETWRTKRRPELLKLFEQEEYGKALLGRPKAMKFVIRDEKHDARGGRATRFRVGILFEGTESGRQMELLVYLPNKVKKAPVFLGLNFDGNYACTDDADIPVPTHWVNGIFKNKPTNNKPPAEARGIHKELWQIDMALDNGFGVAMVAYGEIEPDANDSWKVGPRGLAKEPGKGDWGQLATYAWALRRAMDYLQTNPRVDSKRVALTGFSRLGKAALWACAQDERFALVVSNESGAGGAALHKRIFGETTADLNRVFARWFCGNFVKYAGNEADMPYDQHELIALIAPRPVLIISADKDLWSDPKGEFLSGVGADRVYRLVSGEGISQKEWPAAQKLIESRIGYYLRPGPHDVTAEDWRAMITYAQKYLKSKR
ncbi:MAG: acetylxylan esterase [Chthonomonadales bacterium]